MIEKKLVLDMDNPPSIPRDVAVCPICDADIFIDEICEWNENGSVSDCGIKVQCVTEPRIDSLEWRRWFEHHWSMPYVDWLPVEKRVLDWLNRTYIVASHSEAEEMQRLADWNRAAIEFGKRAR